MDKRKNYLALRKFCLDSGADLFGVAEISQIKKTFAISQKLLQRFDRAVSLGVRLSAGALEEIENAPTRLYFHHYRTTNVFLDQLALKLANHIQKKNFSAIPVPASQIVDWQKQTGHLSHKALGALAGLGWIGRNNLLVNEKLGSQFRLVSVLTDLPLKIDAPLKRDCGDCFLCANACPAGAIKNSAQEFKHLQCFEQLKEFQKQRLVDQYICGICVNLCKGRGRMR